MVSFLDVLSDVLGWCLGLFETWKSYVVLVIAVAIGWWVHRLAAGSGSEFPISIAAGIVSFTLVWLAFCKPAKRA